MPEFIAKKWNWAEASLLIGAGDCQLDVSAHNVGYGNKGS
jgi:hypothetical protein